MRLPLLLLLCLLTAQVALGDTFVVTRTDDPAPNGCAVSDCSLREAVMAANERAGSAHTIQLTAGETYVLTREGRLVGENGLQLDDGAGALKVLSTASAITITTGGGGHAVITNTTPGNPVVLVGPGVQATLDHLEFRSTTEDVTAGVVAYGPAHLAISNSRIIGHPAAGLYIEGGRVAVSGSTIADNVGNFLGGGVTMSAWYDESAGEILEAEVTIEDSEIRDNVSTYGAGMLVESNCTVRMVRSSITGNRATSFGGAVYVSGGSLVIENSSLSYNAARNDNGQSGRGGALGADGGTITILNTTMSHNEVGNLVNSGEGGAIYSGMFSDVDLRIVNSTLAENKAWNSPGILFWGGTLRLGNTILANSTAASRANCRISEPGDVPTVFISEGHNLSNDGSCDLTGEGDMENLDPFLTPAEDHGGPGPSHTLLPQSPAINNGSNAVYSAAGGDLASDTDAAGNPRVFEFQSGGTIDIGATEYQGEVVLEGCPATNDVLYVKKGATGTGANWFNALGELQDALALVETGECSSEEVEAIWVARGTYLPTDQSTDRNASFRLIPQVHLYGGFAGDETSHRDREWAQNPTILSGDIDGDGTLTGNSYHVIRADSAGFAVVVDGFIITGGNADGDGDEARGGGIFAKNQPVSVLNTVFQDNAAGQDGGGFYNEGGRANIAGSFFLNNVASSGNGGGFASVLQDVSVVRTGFHGNQAAAGLGGAIAVSGGDPQFVQLRVRQNSALNGGGIAFINDLETVRPPMQMRSSLFVGNTATEHGGAVYLTQGTTSRLSTLTIVENEAGGEGGGIYIGPESTTMLNNAIIWDNEAGGAVPASASIYHDEAPPSIAHSLIGLSGGSGDWNVFLGVDEGNNIDADPLFLDPEADDFRLSAASPAVDAGNLDLYTDAGGRHRDEADVAGNYRLEGEQIDLGAFEYSETATDAEVAAPYASGIVLHPNYPNPASGSTTIAFELPKPSAVRLEVYDVLGRRVAVLAEGAREAGIHRVELDARDLTNGMYFYRLVAGGRSHTRTMHVIR